MNPYSAPRIDGQQTRPTKQQILSGETTAGPLAVWMTKNPRLFWIGTAILLIGSLGGLAIFVGHP